jgi:excisionase family DNA binding protein
MSTLPVRTPVRQRVTPMLAQTMKAVEQMRSMTVDPLMPLSKAVPLLGNVSYGTLRRWIASGALRVHRATPRGHFRVRLSEVERFRTAGEVQP